MDKTSRKAYFDLQKIRFEKCIEPNESCEEPPIRAHSIQNARVLERLSEDGHVIMPKLSHDPAGIPVVVFDQVGRNLASTFTGLCASHDAEIFRPIDEGPVDAHNPEHLFLLAYRSVLQEAHACFEAASKLQSGYIQRVERGISPGDSPDDAGILATAWLCNAYDMYCYKRKYDEAFLAKKHEAIRHIPILFTDTKPSIAVSALISLDDFEWPNDVARTVLNLVPIDQGTLVVFSFLSEEESFVRQYFQRVLYSSGPYQKYLISKVILQHTQNFVLAPAFFHRLSEQKREAIKEFFCKTVSENMHDYDNENLYLFWDSTMDA